MRNSTKFFSVRFGISLASILIGLFILSVTSCEDDSNRNVEINGEYTWEKSIEGFAGLTLTPETEILSRKLVLIGDNYKLYQDDSLVLESSFSLVNRQDTAWGTNQFLVLDLGIEYAAKIERTSLILYEIDWTDGYHNYYIR